MSLQTQSNKQRMDGMYPFKKRKGKAKVFEPVISNTGFIGVSFVDTNDLTKESYPKKSKHLRISPQVMEQLMKWMASMFTAQNNPVFASCVYYKPLQIIGFVLSSTPYSEKEGKAYFLDYLRDYGYPIEYTDEMISNTGFRGAVFVDLSTNTPFTFEFEIGILTKLMPQMFEPIRNSLGKLGNYASVIYAPEQNKIGFVLSLKPFEKDEGVYYFLDWLEEKGLSKEKEYEETEQLSLFSDNI